MAKGVYDLPNQMVDEDKWFKFFTKKQLIFVGIGGALCFLVMRLALDHNMFKVGVTVSIVIAIITLGISMFKVPESYYLYGSGKYIYSTIAAVIIRKSPSNKVIYCKNYDINCEVEDDDDKKSLIRHDEEEE